MEQTQPRPTPAPRRRVPRYRVFIGTGVLVGLVLAVVLVAFGGRAANFSVGAQLGYLAAILALIGGLLGGGAAVLAERFVR